MGRGWAKKDVGILNRNTTNHPRWVYTNIFGSKTQFQFPKIPLCPHFAKSQKEILNGKGFKWQSIYVIFTVNKIKVMFTVYFILSGLIFWIWMCYREYETKNEISVLTILFYLVGCMMVGWLMLPVTLLLLTHDIKFRK